VTPTDVTDTEAIDAMVEETVDAFGGIDILVNNAGVLKPDPVTDADRTDLRSQIEVNLLGAMNTTHAVLPHLLEGELGDVITVSSMNARHAARGGSAYTASKYGINGFCDSLRKEMSEEAVRVTVILPGPVVTEMRQWDDWEGRPLDPHDVAEAIVFAVSRPPHVELPDIPVNSTDKLG
jgi:NADP-dependent 3-hydroxy acid dehydrogenase YdfG